MAKPFVTARDPICITLPYLRIKIWGPSLGMLNILSLIDVIYSIMLVVMMLVHLMLYLDTSSVNWGGEAETLILRLTRFLFPRSSPDL